ncbi:speriolin-like protein [Engraulis encrasicolus]|uniref:speriolin-like protein n=1 Tax=Engraulis encrasicolus TaxID=184585 RepID=UPI002FD0A449
MDLMDQSRGSMRVENERLRRENEELKLVLALVKENQDLRSKLYGNNTDTSVEQEPVPTAGGRVASVDEHEEPVATAPSPLPKARSVTWDISLDNGSFSTSVLKEPFRTSSPLETSVTRKSSPLETSVTRKSSPMETNVTRKPSPLETSVTRKSALKSSRRDPKQRSEESKVEARVVGEIAFQLDRRILALIFQEQHRLYGFTVQNIADKITQVSTHPVTGEVDKCVRARLCERHLAVTERLGRLGYDMAVHPALSELLVNTYGILRQRPDPQHSEPQHSDTQHSDPQQSDADSESNPPLDRSSEQQRSEAGSESRRHDYSCPEVLRRVVVETVPPSLLKDVLLLLVCLRYLAKHDGKPLLLW